MYILLRGILPSLCRHSNSGFGGLEVGGLRVRPVVWRPLCISSCPLSFGPSFSSSRQPSRALQHTGSPRLRPFSGVGGHVNATPNYRRLTNAASIHSTAHRPGFSADNQSSFLHPVLPPPGLMSSQRRRTTEGRETTRGSRLGRPRSCPGPRPPAVRARRLASRTCLAVSSWRCNQELPAPDR